MDNTGAPCTNKNTMNVFIAQTIIILAIINYTYTENDDEMQQQAKTDHCRKKISMK